MENVTAVITQESAKISCNFEQVEVAIKETLAEYKGAVFTEDSKAIAKKEVASLRSQKKALQDNLRTEKKRYMEPWDEFESQAKALIAMYDEPIDFINGQVQEFEIKRIEKKKELIEKIYSDMVPEELIGYIPLARIYNKKWENATTKEKDIRSEVLNFVEKTRKDIDIISGMKSEAVQEAFNIYRNELDLSLAIAHINSYEQQKQQIIKREQERLRREEEERVRREERERILAEQRAKEEQEAAQRKAEEEKVSAVEQAKKEAAQEVIDSSIPESNDSEDLYEYRISLSADAKEKLEMYMNSVGIEWEMIS